jgi:hypothetical protein
MNQEELCRIFCGKIKRVQLVRLKKSGFTSEEANDIWFKYRREYLRSWREFVDFKLISLPKGLKKVLFKSMNNFIYCNKGG